MLADLAVGRLAERLEQVAFGELPPTSPRLRKLLREHGVVADRCQAGAPSTLEQAASNMPCGAFGEPTQRVARAAMMTWRAYRKAASVVAKAAASEYAPSAAPVVKRCERATSAVEPMAAALEAAAPAQLALTAGVRGVRNSESGIKVPGRHAGGRLPISPAIGTLPDRSTLVTSSDVENFERHKAGAQLLAAWPAFMHPFVCSLSREDFASLSLERSSGLLKRKFGSFSAGSIGGCRRAVRRLVDWLHANGLADGRVRNEPPWLVVSGGFLALWVEDEQSASRGGKQGGAAMPASLKAGIAWGVAHAGLTGIDAKDDTFLVAAAPSARPPKQAISITLRVLAHMRVLRAHECEAVAYYAAAFELTTVASLRVRDAQRAELTLVDEIGAFGAESDDGGKLRAAAAVQLLGYMRGMCYTSKHPKRRSPKPKLFGAPRRVGADADDYLEVLERVRARLGIQRADYLFPRTTARRGHPFGSEGTTFVAGPAPSAEVIRRMRSMLQLPPLSLSAAEAASFSGHSARHFMVCFATSVAAEYSPPRYSSDELAMTGDWQEGMVALYSSETLERRRLALLARILDDVDAVLTHATTNDIVLPAAGGWADMGALLVAAVGGGDRPKRAKSAAGRRGAHVEPTGALAHEDSSSGSDSDGE